MSSSSSIFSIGLALMVATTMVATTAIAQNQTITQTAIAAGNFNTLVAALKAADLAETLDGHQQFTVFAPTDEAFAQLEQSTLNSLLEPENKAKLSQVLTYHVLPGTVPAKDAYDLNSVLTVNGQSLGINFRGKKLIVGGAQVSVTDIQCSNGIIHVIDTVLMPELKSIPEIATANGKFNTLLAAANAGGLVDALAGAGPLTVFAPTDEAFSDLPAGTLDDLLKPENKQKLADILKYHVVQGRIYSGNAIAAESANTLLGQSVKIGFSAAGISINEAKVVVKDISASNGVIHVIDKVLIPQAMTPQSAVSYLNDAINKGVPVYNAGHHQQCCDIYMASLKHLKSAGISGANEHTMSIIDQTIESAQKTHNAMDRAWALRRGIDSLYARLEYAGQMMTIPNR